MATAGPDGGGPFVGGEDGPADATVLRMLLGAQLRRFREAAGVTPEAAAYEIRASPSVIRSFEVQFVPGLFQTEDYARAVTIPQQPPRRPELADETERRVALRLKRQDLLSRPDPPWVWAVVDEAVLRRPAGGPAVMRAQFRHLIELASLERVTIQVVPFASGIHAAESGSFTILRFAEQDLPDVVYAEQLTGALYLDQRQDVERYLQVASELSGQALTPADTIRFIEQVARDL